MAKIIRKEYILLVIILIAMLINYRIALGIILGYIFYLIYQYLLEKRVDYILKAKEVNFLSYISNILSLVILALPFLISLLFPKVFHWSGALIGMMFVKIYMYINSFIGVNND